MLAPIALLFFVYTVGIGRQTMFSMIAGFLFAFTIIFLLKGMGLWTLPTSCSII